MNSKIQEWYEEHKNENYAIECKMEEIYDYFDAYNDEVMEETVEHIVYLTEDLEIDRVILINLIDNVDKDFDKDLYFIVKDRVFKSSASNKNSNKARLKQIEKYIKNFSIKEEEIDDTLDEIIYYYQAKEIGQKVFLLS
jgi:hypothetical protein